MRMHGEIDAAPAGVRRRTSYILGVRYDDLDGATALRTVEDFVAGRDGERPRRVVFTNVHTVHLARGNREFLGAVNDADLVLPDGSGLSIAARVLGGSVTENLNGTDFVPRVLERARALGWTVYLLGGRPGVASSARAVLLDRLPGLKIAGFHSGFFTPREEGALIREINAARPDILLVALGSPVQELWAARNLHRIDAGVCFAVGGLFDFLSGAFRRAPAWMRRMGIEWVYRFLGDPLAKWERVFVEMPVFLTLTVAARIGLILRSLSPRNWSEPPLSLQEKEPL